MATEYQMNEEETCFYNNLLAQPNMLRDLLMSRSRRHDQCTRGDLAEFGMWPCGTSWSFMARDLYAFEALEVGVRIPKQHEKVTKLIVEGFSCAESAPDTLDPSATPRCIEIWRKIDRLMRVKNSSSEQDLNRLIDEPLDTSQKLNAADLPKVLAHYRWDSTIGTTDDQKSRWERATNCVSKMWQPDGRTELLCAGLFDRFTESVLEDDPDWGHHFREMKRLNCVMNPAKSECIASREAVTKKVEDLIREEAGNPS
eukprot:TRINITY_DN17094_c0_g1_i1.p1 TRINITY_DN17094_c0_g1~~TRINITY_DN17094_c0_g1_i1.p1  ORF type:complete len:265 (-),score=17.14 TRINITY_DN17094_c0_g1_i1:45-812(-)